MTTPFSTPVPSSAPGSIPLAAAAPSVDALYALFRRNFPFCTREEGTVRALLSHPDNVVFAAADGSGACVLRRNVILLLAVDAPFRRRGIGSALLRQAEAHLRREGYGDCCIGAGEDYLCPGVPVTQLPYPETLYGFDGSSLDRRIPPDNLSFFTRRGYAHAWGDANCFDMAFSLQPEDPQAGGAAPCTPAAGAQCPSLDQAGRISVHLAGTDEADAVRACASLAHPPFAPFYADDSLYAEGQPCRALAAWMDGRAVGCLLLSTAEEEGTGSLGCVAVMPSLRGQGIASQLVQAGVALLREAGCRRAFLGYTYSGLDRLYGKAGYRPCVLYLMARKDLSGLGLTLRERREEHVAAFFDAVSKDPLCQRFLPQAAKTLDQALAAYRDSLLPTATSFGRTIHIRPEGEREERYVGDVWAYSIDPTAPEAQPQAMVRLCVFDKSARGKGVASRALQLFLEGLMLKFSITRVGAFSFRDNIACVRVLAKNGFSLQGAVPPDSGYYQNF